MVDEIKGIRDSLIGTILSAVSSSNDGSPKVKLDLKGAKDLVGTVAAIAGKGKDEIVQIICREIGIAVAAMLEEPVTKVLENRKLQVTLELIGDNPEPGSKKKKKKTKKKSAAK